MKKFGLVIATVIVMALTGCGNKETTMADDKAVVNVSTEATTEVEATTETTTEEVVKTTEKKEEKTTESVAQTTTVTPVQPTSSQPTTQTSTPKPAQQTSSQTSTPKPSTTEAPKPATTEAPAPVHQHTWATRTETVTDAWTETVEHPAVTHTERHVKCNYCGGFYSDMYAHLEAQEDNDHFCAGWSEATQTIVDQEAWIETINHPAVTKTVEYCTECSATK